MKVLKSYGTDGSVVVSLSAEDSREFDQNEPVFIDFDGLPVPFFMESCTPKGGRYIVKFEDIDTLEDAEKIVGQILRTSIDEEEYEDDPFIGMTVYDASGNLVGEVVEFYDFSGNTCIEVLHDGREVMLPVNEDLIVKIKKNKLYLTIPDGLL